MNKVVIMGRLTRDPEIRYLSEDRAMARYTMAVDRRLKKESDEQTADFISCVSFGNTATFLEKYGRRGTKFIAEGRIQTGSYTNKEGNKVYTTDVVVETLEFAESKKNQQLSNGAMGTSPDGFMHIPEGIDEEFPFA